VYCAEATGLGPGHFRITFYYFESFSYQAPDYKSSHHQGVLRLIEDRALWGRTPVSAQARTRRGPIFDRPEDASIEERVISNHRFDLLVTTHFTAFLPIVCIPISLQLVPKCEKRASLPRGSHCDACQSK